jgi:serine/threonine protein kinase
MTNIHINSNRNMLLSESNEIKLADLGWPELMDNTQERNPLYMSPELFKAQFKYYPNTDIW